MLDNILSDALQKHTRVIIPKIGAFVNKKQGDINIISFNSILKFDDGILTTLVAEAEHIDKTVASEKVKAYVEAILKKIDEGSQYKIEGIGNLYKDANGKIQFLESKAAAKILKPAPAKKEDEAPKVATNIVNPLAEKKEPAAVSPVPDVKPATNESPTEKTASSPVVSDSTPVPPIASSKPVASTPTTAPQPTKNPDIKPIPKPEPASGINNPVSTPGAKKPVTAVPVASSSGQSKTILWISLILLVAAIGTVAYLLLFSNTEYEKDSLFDSEMHISEQTVPAILEKQEEQRTTDSQITFPTAKKEVAPTVVTINPQITTQASEKYYVVAGCFELESNADRYVRKLKAEGFAGAKKFGMVRNMHAVCFSEHNSREEAVRKRDEIRAGREPNAWLLKY